MGRTFLRWQQPHIKYLDENNGDGGDSGGGSGGGSGGEGEGDQTKTYTQAEVDALNSSISKLETKNKTILDEKKGVQDKLKIWDGMDHGKLKILQDKYENDEDLKLIADGKHDELIEKKTERMRATHKSELETLTTSNAELLTTNEKLQGQIDRGLIQSNVRAAFDKSDCKVTAFDDLLLRAVNFFKVEEGQLVARDGSGELIRGKDGAITPEEYIESLREKAPHWWGDSESGGLGGSNKKTGGKDIDSQMAEAAEANDMDLYRKLRAEKNKQSA